MSELSRWPVPADKAHLPTADDMLVPRSVWQRGARLTLTPAFGVAAGAYVVCVWIVIGSAASPIPADQLPTASDVGPDQWAAPPDAVEGVVQPYRPRTEQAKVIGPPPEQVDPGFFAGLQNVLNGINSQPGQPRPYQPDPLVTLPAIDPALAPVLDPLGPVPPEILAPPVVGPDGQIVEAPMLGTGVPPTPGAVPPAPGVVPPAPGVVPQTTPVVVPPTPSVPPETPVVTPETPAVAPQTPSVATPTPVVTPEAPVAAPEAPAAAPASPTVVAPSGQTPTTTGQQPLGPPPGPAA